MTSVFSNSFWPSTEFTSNGIFGANDPPTTQGTLSATQSPSVENRAAAAAGERQQLTHPQPQQLTEMQHTTGEDAPANLGAGVGMLVPKKTMNSNGRGMVIHRADPPASLPKDALVMVPHERLSLPNASSGLSSKSTISSLSNPHFLRQEPTVGAPLSPILDSSAASTSSPFSFSSHDGEEKKEEHSISSEEEDDDDDDDDAQHSHHHMRTQSVLQHFSQHQTDGNSLHPSLKPCDLCGCKDEEIRLQTILIEKQAEQIGLLQATVRDLRKQIGGLLDDPLGRSFKEPISVISEEEQDYGDNGNAQGRVNNHSSNKNVTSPNHGGNREPLSPSTPPQQTPEQQQQTPEQQQQTDMSVIDLTSKYSGSNASQQSPRPLPSMSMSLSMSQSFSMISRSDLASSETQQQQQNTPGRQDDDRAVQVKQVAEKGEPPESVEAMIMKGPSMDDSIISQSQSQSQHSYNNNNNSSYITPRKTAPSPRHIMGYRRPPGTPDNISLAQQKLKRQVTFEDEVMAQSTPTRVRHFDFQVRGMHVKYSGPVMPSREDPSVFLPHGIGVARFDNGDTYAGSFENGKMHGIGTFYPRATPEKQRGRFEHDEFRGT